MLTRPEQATDTMEQQSVSVDRAALIEVGIPIVRRTAFRMARRLPPNVEVDDLIGAGTEGLLKAIDNYDPSRGDRFEAYAESRIRGAILDELRSADSMTRYGRQRANDVARVIRSLESKLGRAPADDEVADKLGLKLEEYHSLLGELARGPALARLGETDPDDVESNSVDPFDACDDAEMRKRLIVELGGLPDRMQQLLALYYQHECTQAEIGKILGVTESRVCQMLGEVAVYLRARLLGEGPPKKWRKPRGRKINV